LTVLTLTIAVGVQDRPATAPQSGVFIPDTQVIAHPDFAEIMSAVATIIFAFSGTPAFFPIVAEMRNPQHYVRPMLICQGTVCTVYLVIGVFVYTYCGSYVASPAPGSAGPLMKKSVLWPGVATRSAGVGHNGVTRESFHLIHPINQSITAIGNHTLNTAHLKFPAKYLFVRLLRHSRHLTSPTPAHYITWMCCNLQHRNDSLHHRQRRAEFQQPDSPDRRSAGDFHVLPADGLYVGVR
jgi:hypothetical protein